MPLNRPADAASPPKEDTGTGRMAAPKGIASRLGGLAAWLMAGGLILLTALPRLTALNQYVIVDEADRWRWAENFVYALSRGDWAATLVGDGYPGIVPVWAESLWILLEAVRRSLGEGGWIGEAGLYLIFHEWDRSEFLYQQRLPIVLLNTVLALLIIWAVWRLFGRRVALLGGLLIALDPFYLSDSRVNRAEALITGLITLSILALVFYAQSRRWRYVIISGILGGLSFLTKIQALAILPAIALIGLFIFYKQAEEKRRSQNNNPYYLLPTTYPLLKFGLLWAAAACLTWFLLWPAMWVTPVDTLSLIYNYTTRKVGAEGVNLFFMGQTYADADPGPIFYPFVFLMRVTPLALVGLAIYGLRLSSSVLRFSPNRPEENALAPFSATLRSAFILVIYIIIYSLVMTVGSHKQDRYLMPIFLSVDILAAIGLVNLWDWIQQKRAKSKQAKIATHYALRTTHYIPWILFAILTAIQLAIILPHHPYYYSYFNPLLGDGPTAVRTMRVGWGEGMDQVGAYLGAKSNSRELTVSSRFTHNMLGFSGEQISLLPDGRWTRADYIVLYIQQVQRRQEPSPGFIDYFQSRPAEKVITIGGIDYAWIYPIPFTTPANPQISIMPDQAALLGYRWEEAGQMRLWWENLGLRGNREMMARLVGPTAQTEWTACLPNPAFVGQAQTSGAYVESLCAPALADLPAGIYTVEFGLASLSFRGEVDAFVFPEGWQAATINAAGEGMDTPEMERLEAIAAVHVPEDAPRLDRIYDSRLRLVAYQLDPPEPQPGQTVNLTLYWQPLRAMAAPVRLTIQLADSRSLPLGRFDTDLPADEWLPGEVITTRHPFDLPADLESPLAGQVEVTLRNEAEVALSPTTAAGEPLEAGIARFTIAPERWPTLAPATSNKAVWQNGLVLKDHTFTPEKGQPGQTLAVNLFWQTEQPVAENYAVFVHLLDGAGQIKAQNDALPRAGAYPMPWWQPGAVVEDAHPLALPPDLPAGTYQVVVGLYRLEDGVRLSLEEGGDSFEVGTFDVQK